MNQLKDKVINFFDQKLFLDHSNRSYQIESLFELKRIGFPFQIRTESRNYQHSISIFTDFNRNGNSTVLDNNQNSYPIEFIHTFFESTIFRLVIEFSDVDAIYKMNCGVKNYLNPNEKWFSKIEEINLPVAIRNYLKIIDSILQEQLKMKKLGSDELKLDVNWLLSTREFKNVHYSPTIEELLFGGLDIYNELNL